MNDNKLGGPGYCPKCCRCVDNLSFHVTICTGIDPKNAFIYKPTDNEIAKDREIDDLQLENYNLRKEIVRLKSERDDLQTTANVLEDDCDKYRETIRKLLDQ